MVVFIRMPSCVRRPCRRGGDECLAGACASRAEAASSDACVSARDHACGAGRSHDRLLREGPHWLPAEGSTAATLPTQRASHKCSDGEPILAYRVRKQTWSTERTAIVLVSKRLQVGQARGVLQHVASARQWLDKLRSTLSRGKQRRDRACLQRDIESRLKGRSVWVVSSSSNARATIRNGRCATHSIATRPVGRGGRLGRSRSRDRSRRLDGEPRKRLSRILAHRDKTLAASGRRA
jgi:hypothetical protein